MIVKETSSAMADLALAPERIANPSASFKASRSRSIRARTGVFNSARSFAMIHSAFLGFRRKRVQFMGGRHPVPHTASPSLSAEEKSLRFRTGFVASSAATTAEIPIFR
jgi:hypothetical protein